MQFHDFKNYRSGELLRSTLQEQHKKEMGTTLYIGSMQSEVYFCLYEKDYEQFIKKGIPMEDAPIKNRFEIRLKNQRADLAVDDLLAFEDVEHTAFSIINYYLQFVDRDDNRNRENWDINPEWACFIGDNREKLELTTQPEPYSFDRTLNWLSHQTAPSFKTALLADEF